MIENAGTPIVLLILHPLLRLVGRVAQEVKTVKEIMEEFKAMEKMAEKVLIMAMEEFPLPTPPHLLFQIQVVQFHLFTLITSGHLTGGQNGQSALERSTTSKSSTPALTSIQVKVTKNVFVTRTQPTTTSFLQSVLLEMKELRQAQAQAKSESSGQSLGKVTVSSTKAQQREGQ